MHARPIRSSLGPDPNGSTPVCTGLKLSILSIILLRRQKRKRFCFEEKENVDKDNFQKDVQKACTIYL